MSLKFWSTSGVKLLASLPDHTHSPPPSTALDFLATIHSAKLIVYSLQSLDLRSDHYSYGVTDLAGLGGHAVVQIGRAQNNTRVAVKRSPASHATQSDDQRRIRLLNIHFAQTTLELQILTHKKLRQHPHIVNILGLCVEETASWLHPISTVLEYTPLGSLAAFLHQEQRQTIAGRVDLVRQASEGLNALHELKICHGDVKMQNVLVFVTGDARFIAKISDFGASVVADWYEPEGKVKCPQGTPLLNAPEIRKQPVMTSNFDINAALRTDTFSLGLLLWEVVKNGQSFFDEAWMTEDQTSQGKADIAELETFLDSLPHNTLLAYGHQFLFAMKLEAGLHQTLSQVLDACLQDEPSDRKPIASIVDIFRARVGLPP